MSVFVKESENFDIPVLKINLAKMEHHSKVMKSMHWKPIGPNITLKIVESLRSHTDCVSQSKFLLDEA